MKELNDYTIDQKFNYPFVVKSAVEGTFRDVEKYKNINGDISICLIFDVSGPSLYGMLPKEKIFGKTQFALTTQSEGGSDNG